MANRSDNFTRADSGVSIDSPSDAAGNYTTTATWGIASNTGYNADGAGSCCATLDASSADVEVQVTLTTIGGSGTGGAGIGFRYVDANNFWRARARVSASTLSLQRMIAGSNTTIGTDYSYTPANGDVIKVVADGNDITVYLNGVSRITASDSTHNTATKHGLFVNSDTASRFDDLTITDLGGSPDVTVSASGSALTTGSGTQIPGFEIVL